MENFNGKTVILADGDFPSGAIARSVLDGAIHVVCCDKAVVGYIGNGYGLPDAVVGDLDSLPDEIRASLGGRLSHDPGQDDNDLAKAFRFCISRGWQDIVILGATGKREDHALGNISWLFDFCETVPGIAMITDFGVFTAIRAPGGSVPTSPGMPISFFSADPRQPISVAGVEYPVDGLKFRRWWSATLNKALGDSVELSFSGDPVLVYRAF